MKLTPCIGQGGAGYSHERIDLTVAMTSAYPPGPIEALDAFAEVLADTEAGSTSDAFYGRLCSVIRAVASTDRAVIVRYDEALRRVRVAGAHSLARADSDDDEVSVDTVAIA